MCVRTFTRHGKIEKLLERFLHEIKMFVICEERAKCFRTFNENC